MDSISKANKEKYKHPPSIEMIREKVKNEGLSQERFARQYGISVSFFKMVMCEMKRLPPKYWHLFFELNQNINQPLQLIDNQGRQKKALATTGKKQSLSHNRLASLLP